MSVDMIKPVIKSDSATIVIGFLLAIFGALLVWDGILWGIGLIAAGAAIIILKEIFLGPTDIEVEIDYGKLVEQLLPELIGEVFNKVFESEEE